jgi:uncharacterized protein (TIGR02996 family)
MFHPATDGAFLAAIREHPDDDAPRLVYADWLDEHGDADRAEFIRLQVRLARMAPSDPEYGAIRGRSDYLGQVHHVEWAHRLPQLDGVHWEVFHRGFFVAARFRHPDHFFAHAAQVFAAGPIQELRLHQFTSAHTLRLASTAELRAVRVLDLDDGNKIGNTGAEQLMASRHLRKLSVLLVGRNDLGPAGVRAIAMSGYVRGLKGLRLERNDLFDDGLQYIAEFKALTELKQLDLDRTRTGDDGVKALARSKTLRGLRTLFLSNNQVTDEGLKALAASEAMSNLEQFHLSGNAITDRGVAALAASPRFARLEHLYLRQNRIEDAGALALARSPHLSNLRELQLGENRISDRAADELRVRFRSRVNVY